MSDTHNKIEYLDECLNTQDFIFRKSSENNIDAMIHSGDLWDKAFTADDNGPQNQIALLYKKYSNIFPILIIKGNHDPKGSLKIFNHLNGTKIYATEEVFETIALVNKEFKNIKDLAEDEIPKALFHAITYPEANLILTYEEIKLNNNNKHILNKITNFLTNSKKLNKWGVPNIVVFHGSIKNYKINETQMISTQDDVTVTTEVLNCINPDYVACGHIHLFQSFHPNYPNICYAGSTWAINYGEQDIKSFNIVTLSKNKFEQTKFEIPARKRIVKTINLETDTFKKLDDTYKELIKNETDFLELIIQHDKDLTDKIKKYSTINNLKVYKKIIKKKQNNAILDALENTITIDDEIALFEKYRNITVDKETKKLLKEIYDEYKKGEIL